MGPKAPESAEPVPVDRLLLEADPLKVAPLLLGKVLAHDGRAGRIVEVEAYRGARDPASHAYRGKTPRNASMFGRAGLLYVYFTYGMHWCANVVCGPEGEAAAVLLRALAPLTGADAMRAARLRGTPVRRTPIAEVALCRGPANLTRALGIDGSYDGRDLLAGLAGPGPHLLDDGVPPPRRPARGPRVGVGVAAEKPWRFWVDGDPHVSGPRAHRSSGQHAVR